MKCLYELRVAFWPKLLKHLSTYRIEVSEPLHGPSNYHRILHTGFVGTNLDIRQTSTQTQTLNKTVCFKILKKKKKKKIQNALGHFI